MRVKEIFISKPLLRAWKKYLKWETSVRSEQRIVAETETERQSGLSGHVTNHFLQTALRSGRLVGNSFCFCCRSLRLRSSGLRAGQLELVFPIERPVSDQRGDYVCGDDAVLDELSQLDFEIVILHNAHNATGSVGNAAQFN